jgi:hypothetical protein
MHSQNDNGLNIEGTSELIEHATTYYKNLFGPAPGNLFKLNHNMWKPHEILKDEDNEILSKPFSVEEVKEALFSMRKNKTPALIIFR